MAKAMSEQRLAALVYHGWTLKHASIDKASAQVAEYYLEWDLPEAVRRLSENEVCRFSRLSVVNDVFEIADRGVVITPGVPRADKKKLPNVGDFVILHDRLSDARLAEVRGIEHFAPPCPQGWPLLLGGGLTKKEVRIGMDVWIRNQEDSCGSPEPAPLAGILHPARE